MWWNKIFISKWLNRKQNKIYFDGVITQRKTSYTFTYDLTSNINDRLGGTCIWVYHIHGSNTTISFFLKILRFYHSLITQFIFTGLPVQAQRNNDKLLSIRFGDNHSNGIWNADDGVKFYDVICVVEYSIM